MISRVVGALKGMADRVSKGMVRVRVVAGDVTHEEVEEALAGIPMASGVVWAHVQIIGRYIDQAAERVVVTEREVVALRAKLEAAERERADAERGLDRRASRMVELLAERDDAIARAEKACARRASMAGELRSALAGQDEASRTALAANVVGPWAWMPGGENDLASMSDEMVITMTAGTLRGLLRDAGGVRATEAERVAAEKERDALRASMEACVADWLKATDRLKAANARHVLRGYGDRRLEGYVDALGGAAAELQIILGKPSGEGGAT